MAILLFVLTLAVLPAAVSAGCALLTRGARWGAVLGLGLGYLAGHLVNVRPSLYPLETADRFPWLVLAPIAPIEVTDRLPWLVLAATVVGLVESTGVGATRWRWLGRLGLLVLTLAAVLGPVLEDRTGSREGVVWLAAVGFVALASWANLEAMVGKGGDRIPVGALAILAIGAGAVLLGSGSAVLAMLCLVLAEALASLVVAGLRAPGSSRAPGIVPIAATALTGLVLDGHVYVESMPTSSALLLAAAPVAAWAGRVGPIGRRGGWKAALVGSAAVLAVVGLAFGLALMVPTPVEEY